MVGNSDGHDISHADVLQLGSAGSASSRIYLPEREVLGIPILVNMCPKTTDISCATGAVRACTRVCCCLCVCANGVCVQRHLLLLCWFLPLCGLCRG